MLEVEDRGFLEKKRNRFENDGYPRSQSATPALVQVRPLSAANATISMIDKSGCDNHWREVMCDAAWPTAATVWRNVGRAWSALIGRRASANRRVPSVYPDGR